MSNNFDPMTGEPIRKAEENENVKFDPMTGEPVYGTPVGTSFNAFDGKQKNKKGLPKVLKIVIPVIAIGGIAAAVVWKTGVFLSPENKVLLAFENTANQSHLVQDLDSDKVVESGKFTLSLNGSVEVDGESAEIDASIMQDAASKKASVDASIDISGLTSVDFFGYMDKEKFVFEVPQLVDKALSYNYKEEKTGYITEYLSSEYLDAIDGVLQTSIDQFGKSEKIRDELKDSLLKDLKKLDFEKIGKKKFEVDDKDRNCQGYSVELTYDELEPFIDDIEDVYNKYYGDSLDELNTLIEESSLSNSEEGYLDDYYYDDETTTDEDYSDDLYYDDEDYSDDLYYDDEDYSDDETYFEQQVSQDEDYSEDDLYYDDDEYLDDDYYSDDTTDSSILDYSSEASADTVLSSLSYSEMFDMLRESLKEMPEMKVKVYLYKNQVADIQLTAEGETLEVKFLGGDTRMQNLVVLVSGEEILKVTGDTKNSVEKTKVIVVESGSELDVLNMEYNYKNGDISLKIPSDLTGEDFELNGNIDSSKDSFTLKIDEIKYGDDTIDVNGTIKLKKGANIKMTDSELFDLGTATEDEFTELFSSVSDLGNLFGY